MLPCYRIGGLFMSSAKPVSRRFPARRSMAGFINLAPVNSETFSFLCQDQTVKVDSNIYHLDRFRSSLKSRYFEKFFTSGDFAQRNENVLEIQPKNNEIFSSVVDLIRGKKLIDVLNKENYVQLLEEMDHFEMMIDLKTVSGFIDNNLSSYSPQDAKIFELYAFVVENSKFKYLLESVFKYFSNHMTLIRDHEVISTIPLDHFIRIVHSVQRVNDAKRYEIVQLCTEWLSQDMENRLPHLAILINSIKPKFHSIREDDKNKNNAVTPIPKTDIDEQAKRKTISCCVFALLAYGRNINPAVLSGENLHNPDDEYDHYESDYEYNSKSKKNAEEYEVYKQEDTPNAWVNNNEYNRLRKFLKNGDFCDIFVRVGNKRYALHRAVLESRCGYFADLFRAEYAEALAKCEGIPTYPCKDKEYLLDRIDQSVFVAVLKHIYFGKNIVGRGFENVVRYFEAAEILKIETLSNLSIKLLKDNPREVSSSDIVELLNLIRGVEKYKELYLLYLCQHLSTKWPEIDNVSQFCSISWAELKNVLRARNFHPDDPHKILDICSTWIIHDAKNRYGFLPAIARIINPYCSIDDDRFKTETPADFDDCSRQSVEDKLWEILSSIRYIVPSKECCPKELAEIPVFVALKRNKLRKDEENTDGEADKTATVHVLNRDLDAIAEFSPIPPPSDFPAYMRITSATTIDDNLFVLRECYDLGVLQVYNFSLKKCFRLPFELITVEKFFRDEYWLLNCADELYCCSLAGLVMKFSMQLNRWMIISNHESDRKLVAFTSDGEKLYRMYFSERGDDLSSSCGLEVYDFEKNLWIRAFSLPSTKQITTPPQMTVASNRKIAVSTFTNILLSDRESETWRCLKLPQELWEISPVFAECGNGMLRIAEDKLYEFSPTNENWELKKKVPHDYRSNLVPIHRLVFEAN